jgi:trehalose synthase
MLRHHPIHKVGDYEPFVGAEAIDRILQKAERLRGCDVAHVNSTYYGGGVAELLSSLTLLMNSVGIRTEWRVIQGPPDFFSITKTMHNVLQGSEVNLTELKMDIYEDVVHENAVRNRLEHDFVVVHDPQPLPLINHYRRRGPWIWRCHLDLTNPHQALWRYLTGFIEKYDAVVFSLPEYAQKLKAPQLFIPPAIDPFTIKNRELSDDEIDERLAHHQIPTDLPLVVQISRFDRWKDPEGVIEVFQRARKEVPATLVLVGNVATDDPEGEAVYDSLHAHRDERIKILAVQDSVLVNALQRRAAVVLQKSIREGFGLTVTEAMWKGAAVIGGNAGGIRHQIQDGENGFLVSSVEEASTRIVQLLKDGALRKRLGERARETVREKFLLTRMLERFFDLFNAFDTGFRLNHMPDENGHLPP